MDLLSAEAMAGSPFAEAYARVEPNPDDWSIRMEKVRQLCREIEDLSSANVEAIATPTLTINGDSEIVRVLAAWGV